MARFAFFVGCLDTTDIFSGEMEEYLKQNGHKCLEINVNTLEKDLKRFVREHTKEPFLAAISFNNVGYSLGEEGEAFWEKMDIIYIDILMDHPFCFYSQLSNLSKKTLLYCVDENHVDFVKRYYPGIERVSFLPHGGCLYESQKASKNFERDIDILYPGNLSRKIVENLIPDFDSFKEFDGAEFSGEVLSFLINNPDSLTENVIVSALRERKLDFSLSEELSVINAFRFIDAFAVSYFRELAVRILVENGFKVMVLGNGWESCDWIDNENLSILGTVNATEVLSFMKRSKVVLNTMTWFKKGSHDRVFNGSLCKSAVVTDSSDYLRRFYPEESLSYFDLKEIGKLPYILERLLKDEDYRNGYCEKSYEITVNNHTWGHRVNRILEDLGLQ